MMAVPMVVNIKYIAEIINVNCVHENIWKIPYYLYIIPYTLLSVLIVCIFDCTILNNNLEDLIIKLLYNLYICTDRINSHLCRHPPQPLTPPPPNTHYVVLKMHHQYS